ncbi:MAG: GTPase ObgE [Bacteroidales bacterium]|nr:GTPase ObgE [Bacteroidales bacterium]
MAESNFVDYIKIFCRSGKGGSGSTHFRREKFIPKGGPDGGDGGRGGHIILKGNSHLWTLLHLRYKKHIFAEHGQSGSGAMKTGSDGKDTIIEVPLGTIAKDEEGNVLFEITKDDDLKILVRGGRGGLGNTHFKSATNQTPRYAQPGESEIEGYFFLELKILADVGLVGFPNAGKSTLLSAISAAKPKIANYPFTTLTPNLGIVPYRNDLSFVMADIPGIIEGASEGKGLGIRFLRHIERNSTLLFMVAADSKNIHEEYKILIQELKQYNPELIDKKRILAITKTDLLDEELIEEIRLDLPAIPCIFISSVTQYNLSQLKDLLWQQLNS